MNMNKKEEKFHKKHLFVLASYEPTLKHGGGIANLSALKVYSKFYQKISYIYIGDAELCKFNEFSNVSFYKIPIYQKKKWIRFLLGFLYRSPAVCASYVNPKVKKEVLDLIVELSGDINAKTNIDIIFEDLPISSLMYSIKHKFPNWKYAVRSHNVLSKIFTDFSNTKKLSSNLFKLIMEIESRRNFIFEKKILDIADRTWAISEEDKNHYLEMLGHKCDGVFSIDYNNDDFDKVDSGDIHNIIHLGGLDLRKKDGMIFFVNNIWKAIKARYPKAKLILGGKNSELFNSPKDGIYGLGFVENEVEFLSRGVIFINTQTAGSGIKLKSIVAVLAGKLLVSTQIGVEGVLGENGKHYIRADNWENFEYEILRAIENVELSKTIALEGQLYFKDEYSFENLYNNTSVLLRNI